MPDEVPMTAFDVADTLLELFALGAVQIVADGDELRFADVEPRHREEVACA